MRLLAAGLAGAASLLTGCGAVEPGASEVVWAEPELVAGLGERIGVSAALAASAQGALVAWAGTPERAPAV